MAGRRACHLQQVLERYESYGPYNMLEGVRKEVKRDLETAFLSLVHWVQNKPLYSADRPCDSRKGKGTCGKVLIRVVVSRSEVGVLKIRSESKRKYSKSLYHARHPARREGGPSASIAVPVWG